MSKEFAACLPDWTVRRDPQPADKLDPPIWTDEHGSLRLFKLDEDGVGHYRLELIDQSSVDICFDERLVCEHPFPGSGAQSTCEHFLIDQVLPRILGQQGKLILHAAAVRIGDRAILIVGKSGFGKSTLAASFHRSGHRLLGDDAVLVEWPDQKASVRAVYPSLRLFPDSIDALFGEDIKTESVAHYTSKLRVNVPLYEEAECGSLPIRALFVLNAPREDPGVRIEQKSISKACMALVENSFVLDPTDVARAPDRLHAASKLAGEIPAFDLYYSRAYAPLPAIRAAMLDALNG